MQKMSLASFFSCSEIEEKNPVKPKVEAALHGWKLNRIQSLVSGLDGL